MAHRQLKIWRDDFLRYYHKTSLMTRIVIGAALSFGAAQLLLNKVIRPQNRELAELGRKHQSMEVVEDVELAVADLKNKQRKINMQLESLREINRNLAETRGTLSRNEIGKSILELRLLIDRNELRILSEERLVEKKNARRSRKKKTPDTRIVMRLPASMGCESYRFKVLGSYRHLRHFLLDAFSTDVLFFLNNIKVSRSDELITDRNLNQYKALRCEFEIHIPYRNPAGAQAEAQAQTKKPAQTQTPPRAQTKKRGRK